jgi:hypothetical protein
VITPEKCAAFGYPEIPEFLEVQTWKIEKI